MGWFLFFEDHSFNGPAPAPPPLVGLDFSQAANSMYIMVI